MGRPPSPYYLWYYAGIPLLVLSNNKIKKGQNPTCTYHLHPFYRHTNKHTDAPTCMTVAPDTLHLFTKFEP